MTIGVLAVQGDFAAHAALLRRLGRDTREVRSPADLEGLAGLILPGGESTTMLKCFEDAGLEPAIKDFAAAGAPILATCAGVILLAKEVTHPRQRSLALVDCSVERNAYGRQRDSFIAAAPCPALGERPLEMVFIRAPMVRRVGPHVRVLAEHGGLPVVLEQGEQYLATTFHPELSDDPRIHQRFLGMVDRRRPPDAT